MIVHLNDPLLSSAGDETGRAVRDGDKLQHDPGDHLGSGPLQNGEKSPALDVNASSAGRKTVLVVDDEPTVRFLITEVLNDLDYTSIEAVDGSSGLQILLSDVIIDLMITDVGLPGGMDGRHLAAAARAERPGLAILFITGYAESAALKDGVREPGVMVLTKPFSIDSLTSHIRELTS